MMGQDHGRVLIKVLGLLLLSVRVSPSVRTGPKENTNNKDDATAQVTSTSSDIPNYIERTPVLEKRTVRRPTNLSPTKETMFDLTTVLPLIFSTVMRQPRIHYIEGARLEPTPVPTQGGDQGTGSDTLVIVLAVSCFCFGVIIAAAIAVVVYRRQKHRWKQEEDSALHTPSVDGNGGTPTVTILNNDPMNEFFRYKEGLVSEEIKKAVNFLATPFPVRSINETQNDETSTDPEPSGLTMNSTMTGSHDNEIIPLPPISQQKYINYLVEDTVWAKTDAAVWNIINSDIVVTIPEGAIPGGGRQIFIRVASEADDFHVLTSDHDVQLSLIVILSCAQLNRFDKPVEIRIPHRAYLSTESTWKLRLRSSIDPLDGGDISEWMDAQREVPGCNIRHEVTYRHDADFVYVRTYRLASFCLLGTGRPKRRCLRLTALTYAYPNSTDDLAPVNTATECQKTLTVKVFVVDSFRDVITSVNKIQEDKGGVCICRPTPLRTINEKDWYVILASLDDPYWPWTLDRDTKLKVISCGSIYHSLGTAFESQFRLIQRKSVSAFQATFSLAQRRKHSRKMIHNILSTKSLYLQGGNVEVDCSPWTSDV